MSVISISTRRGAGQGISSPIRKPRVNKEAKLIRHFAFDPREISSTVAWKTASASARGILTGMLWEAWELAINGEHLPADVPTLAALLHCATREIEASRPTWSAFFFVDGSHLRCGWLEEKRAESLKAYRGKVKAQKAKTQKERDAKPPAAKPAPRQQNPPPQCGRNAATSQPLLDLIRSDPDRSLRTVTVDAQTLEYATALAEADEGKNPGQSGAEYVDQVLTRFAQLGDRLEREMAAVTRQYLEGKRIDTFRGLLWRRLEDAEAEVKQRGKMVGIR